MSQGTQSANERTPLLAGSEPADTPASRESTLVEADSIQDGLDGNGEANDAPVKPHVSLIAVVSAKILSAKSVHTSSECWFSGTPVKLLDLVIWCTRKASNHHHLTVSSLSARRSRDTALS